MALRQQRVGMSPMATGRTDRPASRRRQGARLAGLLLAAALSALTCRPTPRPTGKVRVVTTINVLADWARNIGGDRVQVASILTGLESEHTYEAKPAALKLIADADILFRVGLGLEDWLDPVIENAGNRRLTIVDAAKGVPVIQDGDSSDANSTPPQSARVSPHSPGNPHVWLDPEAAKTGIANLVAELIRLDPKGESLYRARQQTYSLRLDSLMLGINDQFSTLPDRRVVMFHSAWPYFARRFGLRIVASIEPVPGQEPSAQQIARLVDLIRREHIKVVCSEPQLPSDIPNLLARETGVRVAILSPLTGGVPGTDDYISLIRYNSAQVIQALR
jgi:ABC-type Zn uptake system ZnuABC Zn-binding protein ZnuA